MKDFWDSRYSSREFAYGKQPNDFFQDSLLKYRLNGDVLFPAEGEGRNAVYAAQSGCNSFAFDISSEGYNKAMQLALENGVKIDYQVGKLEETGFQERKYDAIVLIYAHFPPEILKEYHSKFEAMLKPGGYIILEGFSEGNLVFRSNNPKVGGPDNIDMLFTKDKISNSFARLEILDLEEVEVELNEGTCHVGKGKVIRYVGRKKG